MRFRSGVTDQYIYFVAVDATDLSTRETGLSSFTVYRSRNGAAAASFTTPTINETDTTNMPGVYELLLDEDMTIDAGDFTQAMTVHITHSGMAPVTLQFELFTDPEGDVSDVLSRLTVTNSQLLIVKSDTSDVKSHLVVIQSETTAIQSDTTTLASDLAEGDFSDILSRLTVTNSQLLIVKSDTSDIKSHLTVLAANISDINSDTNKLVSDATEVDTSDLHSLLTLVRSDTAVIEAVTSDIQSDTNVIITKMRGLVLATGTIGATGNTTTVIHIPDGVLDSLSDDEIKYYNVVIYDVSLDEYHARTITAWTNTGDLATVSPALPFTPEASTDLYWILPPIANQFDYDNSDLYSLLTLVRSDTAVVETVTSDIQSDTNKLVSDASEVDTSDIMSMLTLIRSDTTTLASDLAEGDFSDILSRLTVTNSQLLIVKSDTSDIKSALVIVASDTAHIESDAAAIEAIVSDIQSDTNKLVSDASEVDTSDIHSLLTLVRSDTAVIETVTSDIQSDTNVLFTKMRGLVLFNGTIGGTGNSTTAVHLPDLGSYGDDEINNYFLVIFDVSESEYHVRAITDWETTGNTATVSTLPFTPQDSTDLYWLLSNQSSSGALSAAQDSKLTEINSQVVRIHSDTITLASDLAEGDFSDILSRLTVTNSQLLIVKSDTSDIKSHLVVIQSETTAIQSDTTTLASDLAEADFSDIHSRLTLVLSDTSDIRSHLTALTGAGGVISDIASGVDAIQAAGGALTAAQDSKLTQIHSDTQPVGTLFEIVSDIYSDTTAIEAGGGSLTATQASQLARVQSIAIVIEPYTSDTVSMVAVIKSDTSDIQSHLTVQDATLSDIQSDTNKLVSDATEVDTSDLHSLLTLVRSDTTRIESDVISNAAIISDIQSDTNKLVSDATEVDTSDIHSLLTKVYSDTTAIGAGGALTAAQDSKLTRVTSEVTVVHSETTAIQTKTNSLTFTQAGVVDANIQYVNDTQVDGTGTSGDPWGPV